MKPGNVPTSRIGPLLGDLIRDRWPHNGGIEVLAEKVGCDWTAIEGIIKGVHEGVSFDLADKLFCALGRVDVWQGQLSDVYSKVRFMQTCAVPSCCKTFPEQKVGGFVKKYCSPRCATLAHGIREGRCSGERLRQKNKCLKGHKLTPENTYLTKRKDRIERSCRTCQREYQREWARKRRATDPRFVKAKQEAQRRWRATLKVAA